MLKTSLRRHVPKWIKRIVRPPSTEPYAWQSFAQEGEDLILAGLFGGLVGARRGFYVDVGAHHPQRLSNTHFFYLRGWRGINIDAMPGSMDGFRAARPRDINLEAAVGPACGSMTYHCFENSELNGFDASLSGARNSSPSGSRIIATHQVKVLPLAGILNQCLPEDQSIDFLSVDVEGMDLEVLKSNDWDRYRPTVVLVEDAGVESLLDVGRSPVVSYLAGQGYAPIAKTRLTLIFAAANATTPTDAGVQLKEELLRVAGLEQSFTTAT